MWLKVLKARYEDFEHQVLTDPSIDNIKSMSTWWKDLEKIGAITTNFGFDFACTVCFNLREGTFVSF